jgi:hypothetical protein
MGNESEKQDALLCAIELQRQFEGLRQKYGDISILPGMEEMEPFEETMAPAVERMEEYLAAFRKGGLDDKEALRTLEEDEQRAEALVEYGKTQGDVELPMAHRAEKEAEMRGLSAFCQMLVRSAFSSAASGTSDQEWIQGVLDSTAKWNWPWVRKGYEAAITSLRAEGPWPWPR